MHRRLLLLIPWWLAACTVEPPATSSATAAITGGTPDPGDPAVIAIVARPVACQGVETLVCTGTLIGERAVLTAAHCLDPGAMDSVVVRVGARLDEAGAPSMTVVAEVAHPDFVAGQADVGVLELAAPLPVVPVRFAAVAPAELVDGATVRLVGFGADDDGATGGKRAGTAVITEVTGDRFEIGPAPAMSCGGDSGGPVLLDTADGEQVVGVTSSGDPACQQLGVNMRVDAFAADFVTPTLDAIAASPAPAPRASLDERADLCVAACVDDADCPQDTACVARDGGGGRACGFLGAPPGRFDEACAVDDDCPGGFCAAARGGPCRCYRACPDDEGDSGCRIAGSGGGTSRALPVLIALLLIARGRRRHRDRARRGCERGPRSA